MVCEELDQLEWDFIQARAGSQDLDSFGRTNREFSCLDAILVHKREGHQGERCPGAQLRVTPVKNIFVGNLDFNTSEEDVRQSVCSLRTSGPSDHRQGSGYRPTARVRFRGDGELGRRQQGHRCPEWNAPRRPRTECK